MKRFLASFLVLSVLSIGFVGCTDKAKTDKKSTTSTEKKTEEKKTDTTPPAPK